MIWDETLETVREVIRECLNLPDHDVQWINTSAAGTYRGGATGVKVDLVLDQLRTIGVDEIRIDYDEDSDTRTETLCGNRHLPLTVQIESQSQDYSGMSVGALADQVRSRLDWPYFYEKLIAKNIAVVSVGDTQNADLVEDDRSVSKSITPLVLAVRYENRITLGTPGDYINRVTGEASEDSELQTSFDTE